MLWHMVSPKILRIPYTRHVTATNASVRETTGSPPVSSIIKTRKLRFFGHVARSDSRQNHHRAISVSLQSPRDWRRPRGRPRTTWLRGIDADVQSANIGIHWAWRKANDRVLWRRIIATATLHQGYATEEEGHSARHYDDNFLLQRKGNVPIARQQPF